MTGATAILVVQVEIEPEDEAEFNRWYDEEHIPEKLATRGFLSARRFRVHDGTPRYLAVYELAEPQAALSAEYMANQPSEWGKRVMERWRAWNREVWIDLAAQPRP